MLMHTHRLGPPHATPAPEAAAEEAEAWDEEEEAPYPPGLSIQEAEGSGAAEYSGDMDAVPLDDLLIDSLVKLAGGAKKGTTFPSHLSLAELQSRMLERMTPMHKVEVESEAPAIKKGAPKPHGSRRKPETRARARARACARARVRARARARARANAQVLSRRAQTRCAQAAQDRDEARRGAQQDARERPRGAPYLTRRRLAGSMARWLDGWIDG
jgi:hypothetical protein